MNAHAERIAALALHREAEIPAWLAGLLAATVVHALVEDGALPADPTPVAARRGGRGIIRAVPPDPGLPPSA